MVEEQLHKLEELVRALFEELLNVGDEEKEYAIWWWGSHKYQLAKLVGRRPQDMESLDADSGDLEGQATFERRRDTGKARESAARL